MTNQEYLSLQLSKFGVSTDDISLMLIEANLNGNDQVSDTKSLKTAIYNQLPIMMAGLQDVSEGGYSVKWNYDGIKAWYSWLASSLGLPNLLSPTPTVTGIKPW